MEEIDYKAYPHMPEPVDQWALYLYGVGRVGALQKIINAHPIFSRCSVGYFVTTRQCALSYYMKKINEHHVFSGKIYKGYVICDAEYLNAIGRSSVWREVETLRHDEALVSSDMDESLPMISHASDGMFFAKNYCLVDDVTQIDNTILERVKEDPHRDKFLGWNAKRKGYRLVASRNI